MLATTAGHALFLFLIAGLIALLLDPLVLRARAVAGSARPRGRARVLDVRGGVGRHPRRARHRRRRPDEVGGDRFNDYFTVVHGQSSQTAADRDVVRLQLWLNTHHLRSVKIEKSGHRFVQRIQRRDVGRYTHRLVTFVEGAAISIGEGLFEAVLMVVSRSTCCSAYRG